MKTIVEYLISKENKSKIGKQYPDDLCVEVLAMTPNKQAKDGYKKFEKDVWNIDNQAACLEVWGDAAIWVMSIKDFKTLFKDNYKVLNFWDVYIYRDKNFDINDVLLNQKRYIEHVKSCVKGNDPDGFLNMNEIEKILKDK